MSWAGLDKNRVGMTFKLLNEAQGNIHGSRRIKNSGMGYNPQKTGEDKIGKTETLVLLQSFLQPTVKGGMIGGIFPVGINKNIDIAKDQSSFSIRSKSSDI